MSHRSSVDDMAKVMSDSTIPTHVSVTTSDSVDVKSVCDVNDDDDDVHW